ncbi:MAG: ABC transporter permease/substrate-binding protein, partial [Planctomycetes bacterium]|nr:ABC transporter permease/substrate-binding protein [Planctomycetota bacterium]
MIAPELWANIVRQFESLPERLGGHIVLSIAALLAGTMISLPLGIYAARHRKLEHAALMIASIIQTIPSLALLALMVFAWGTIGWIPALIALILYSILPTLRNTITGLQGVNPACIEAARGVGMTDRQMLWSVQLPLAAPTILAGVRTASVWVVGLATIAQPVGATSLGNYIFVGLQTLNSVSLLFGCVFSALLALALDGLFLGLEHAARHRSWPAAAGVLAGLVAVAVSPLLLMLIGPGPNALLAEIRQAMPGQADTRPVVIGGKPFTEQYVLTSLLQQRLEQAGCSTQLREGLGSTILFEALHSGDVDCYVDYTGTILATIMHQQDSSSPAETLVDVAAFLKSQYEIISLGPLGFDNSYVFAMPADRAKAEGIRSLSDLASRAGSMKAGTDVEFFARPEWRRVRELYGLDFEKKVTMDATLMYGAVVAGQLDVIAAYSTDGRIAANNLVILEDP